MVNVGYFLRTHFWDERTSWAFDLQQKAAQDNVTILYDETGSKAHTDAASVTIPYSLGGFERIGLPIFPNAEKCLWYCGDYVLMTMLQNSDCDYFCLMEYDFIPADHLSETVKSIASEKIDLVAHQSGPAVPRWFWNDSTIRWYSAELGAPFPLTSIYQCNFPVVIISRNLARDLVSRRLEMARFRRASGIADWVHCEPFVVTEAIRLGYSIAPLKKFGDVTECSTNFPINGEVVSGLSDKWRHPVLFGTRYVYKLAGYVRSSDRDWSAAQLMNMCVSKDNWEMLREGLIRFDSKRWSPILSDEALSETVMRKADTN